MASGQNKIIRLYGPWRGVADSDGESSMGSFELGFNLYQDGDCLRTRGGMVPFSALHSAVTTPRRLHALTSGNLCVTGDSAVTIDYGSRTTNLTTDADFANGGLWRACRIGRYVFVLDDDGKIVVLDEWAGTANLLTLAIGADSAGSPGVGYLTALPRFVAIEAYNTRLFGVTETGTVVFSEVENRLDAMPSDGSAPYGGLNLWRADRNFDLGPSTASYGLSVLGGYIACFSSQRVVLFDENSVQDVPSGHGCLAPESIALTPKGVVYLAPDGVRVLSGATSVLVSEGVSETIAENIPTGGGSPCVGVHIPSMHHYRLFVPIRESLEAQAALVWDYENGEWFMWGALPPWDVQAGYYAVTSAVVLPSVGADERLVTTAPGRISFIHDVGDLDCVSASAYREIDWFLAFKPIGFGEDQGVAVWRDLRIEAMSDATHIRAVVLTDGEKFEEGAGAIDSALATYPYVQTEIATQSTWTSTAPADAELYTGSGTASAPRWYSWRLGIGKVARTAQVVLWNGLVTPATDRTPGRVNLRGVELEARQRQGRR